ncbi:type IV fimbrial biogenesis protein FimT [Alkalispirillum mobile]|uniref:Type II secretion system protein H n=1 Tax=Alkalispirillum mobile TaxID=85925 RepID=A0A498C7S8_9GAMM|nr:type IV fimbrial biogenesis protein FimT [Alkalispirillum mobile]
MIVAQGSAPQRQSGVTLIEFAVVLIVLAVMASLAAPHLSRMLDNHRTQAAQQRFTTTLYAGRQHAVLNGVSVVICKSSGGPAAGCGGKKGWDSGWLVFEDPGLSADCVDNNGDGYCHSGGRLLISEGSLPGGVVVAHNHNVRERIRYNPRGASPGYNGRLSFCPSPASDEAARGLVISSSGRVRPANRTEYLPCPAPDP